MAPRKTATKKTPVKKTVSKKTSVKKSAPKKKRASKGGNAATATVTETPVAPTPAPEPVKETPAPVVSEPEGPSLADEVSAFRTQLREMTDALRQAVKSLDTAATSGRKAVRSKEHDATEFNAQTTDLRNALKSLVDSSRAHVKTLDSLDRRVRLELRSGTKTRRKRTQTGPSSFQIPLDVTDEFRAFVNEHNLNNGGPLGPTEQVSRVQAGRMLNAYIDQAGLKNADDRRMWTPDSALRSLFHLDEGVTYSDTAANRRKNRVGQDIDTSGTLEFWHLPGFMSRHFVKA